MGIELCAVEKGFGRDTADIEAGPADIAFFDERDAQMGFSKAFSC
jgi:hypothetical protein